MKIKMHCGVTVGYHEVRNWCRSDHVMLLFRGFDARVVRRCCDAGIDEYLETCFSPGRGDHYEWQELGGDVCLVARVSRESLPILLRRLVAVEEQAAGAEAIARAIVWMLTVDFEAAKRQRFADGEDDEHDDLDDEMIGMDGSIG